MTQKQIALKIDVDTWRGTREGLPRLLECFDRHQLRATFLFSLGPDHTGRAIKRVFRKGFLQKVSRTSVVSHYGFKTLLYGTLLPGPDIGVREAARLRAVEAAGHEVGIHCWDHIRWQDSVAEKDRAWTAREMERAQTRFNTIFGRPARTHGAAGWQMNPAAYAIEAELGFVYASDTRGEHPFQPVSRDGSPLGVPQLPTTLPTLDELIGIDGIDTHNVHQALLARTAGATRSEVYTLHAELEGMQLYSVFEKLIIGWKAQGFKLGTCDDLFSTLDVEKLPRHEVGLGTVPGRSGTLACQGAHHP